MKINNINVVVCDDYNAVGVAAGEIFEKAMLADKKGAFGFATGSTPIGLYKELIKKHQEGLDFSGITTFNLDEYFPIKKESDQSYDYFMRKQLFDHVNIDYKNFNIPNGEAADAEAECADYEKKLRGMGGVKLQILGIGHNGHIGFNEPESHFAENTHVVDLQESTIDANSRLFEKKEDVPRKALTMGIGTIMLAKEVLLIATGEGKAEIMEKVLFGEITPMVPASVLRFHPNVTFVMDKAAAERVMKRL